MVITITFAILLAGGGLALFLYRKISPLRERAESSWEDLIDLLRARHLRAGEIARAGGSGDEALHDALWEAERAFLEPARAASAEERLSEALLRYNPDAAWDKDFAAAKDLYNASAQELNDRLASFPYRLLLCRACFALDLFQG